MSVKLDLMRSGIISLPGGIDNTGHLVFSFPTQSLSLIGIRYSGAHLMSLVQQYIDNIPYSLKGQGFAFLIDMRNIMKDTVQAVIETVEKIECEQSGVVSCMYAVEPVNKETLKVFRKLTGLKPSKKVLKTISFPTVAVTSLSQLNSHIDPCQRTIDFAGSLRYSHDIYMRFFETFQGLETKVERVEYKLPAAKDKVSMLQEYELPSRLEGREKLLKQIHNKFHDVMRDLNIETVIGECTIILEKMKAPESSSEYCEIMTTPLFGSAKSKIEVQLKDLIDSKKELQSLFHKADERIVMPSKLNKYTTKAQKVLHWVQEIGNPTVMQEPEIGDCLSKAELYKHHFEAGFFTIAQNVLWLSDKITKKIENATQQQEKKSDNDTNSRKESMQEADELQKFLKRFQTRLFSFRAAVEKKHELYNNIYQFFLTSDKLSVWYKRTLKFLPLQLLQSRSTTDTHQVAVHSLYPTDTWVLAVENYLMYNPCPKPVLMQKLLNLLPEIDNISIRNQARILIHRIEVLFKVLNQPKLIPKLDQEISDISRWKDSLTNDNDILSELTCWPEVSRLNHRNSLEVASVHQNSVFETLLKGDNEFLNQKKKDFGSVDILLDTKKGGSLSSAKGAKIIETPKKPKKKKVPTATLR